ncbi:hypothetical protein [Shewanella sp. CG12_big_fil_rev_8_21_14_0_65_47_15]|uniref:hypothetical protein n=1 Tax=Shewanella sp. CG12_big_fil_rev_8_21_14_0_65_47_15 TaxID=1975537 RepID=UPI000CC5C3F0|nr:hypothetical protein [Shewanella sp. CG12_big_fil_rev_8_21_14_0_65_47_15]PIW58941.1 MAG: hypothetical protein COW15_19800 [Shewanella sp. CG12_big_fil_rev_8_21_14_0_65_47_15]
MLTYYKYSFFICLLIQFPLFADTIETTELPPILNYMPSCSPNILKHVQITRTLAKYDANIPLEENPDFTQALLDLRLDAKRQQADAVILTNIHNVMRPETKNLASTKTSHFNADFIRYCKDNSQLSEQVTPYNDKGIHVVATISYSFQLADAPSLAEVADSIQVPLANISLDSGAFGIPLGAKVATLTTQLGPASIEIMLDSSEQALGYGRGIWFIIRDGMVNSIQSGNLFMSGYGKNLIGYREGFDSVSWGLEGGVQQNNSLEEVKLQLGAQLKNSASEYLLSNRKAQLRLLFESFNPVSKEQSIEKLTGFVLENKNNANTLSSPKLATTTQVDHTIGLINPFNLKQKPKLKTLLDSIGSYHKLNLSDSGIWWLLGNHLQVQYEQGELRRAQIAQELFNKPSPNLDMRYIAKQLAFPYTKAEILTQYPNATDNFDQVQIRFENFELEAKFETEADDAAMYQLNIEYF